MLDSITYVTPNTNYLITFAPLVTVVITVGWAIHVFKHDRIAKQLDRDINLRKETYLQIVSSGFTMLSLIPKIFTVKADEIPGVAVEFAQNSAILSRINLIGSHPAIEQVINFNSDVLRLYSQAVRGRDRIEYVLHSSAHTSYSGDYSKRLLREYEEAKLKTLLEISTPLFKLFKAMPKIVISLREDLDARGDYVSGSDFYSQEYLTFMNVMYERDYEITVAVLKSAVERYKHAVANTL